MNVINTVSSLQNSKKAFQKPTKAQMDMYYTFKLYTRTYALTEFLNQMERAFGINKQDLINY